MNQMKTLFKGPLLLPVLVTGLSYLSGAQLSAQTFTTLYSFNITSDGYSPNSLILSGSTLYGTAQYGGTSQGGSVFAVNNDGTGFTTLYSFTGGSDGNGPFGLILSGNSLYGCARFGGNFYVYGGTLFTLATDGTGFTPLYSFTQPTFQPSVGEPTNSDGTNPNGVLLSGGTLYGTAFSGGSGGLGTVFAVNTDGNGFTTLHSFTQRYFNNNLGVYTNSDGGNPQAGPIISGNTLYGTSEEDGGSGRGTVFGVNTDGTGFRVLHSFTGFSTNQTYTNSDGAGPEGLILSGDTLYGTAWSGGSWGSGTVFRVNTNGSGFATLHNFAATSGHNGYGYAINSDGIRPAAALILSVNTLYGTCEVGGTSGNGTVFAINTDGSGFTVLYTFSASSTNASGLYTNSEGAYPEAALILSGNTLYGAASQGGSQNSGTIFSISLPTSPPQLTIATTSAVNVLLSWPTNATGFTLQATTNLGSTAVWTPVSQTPVLVNGQNTLTNPISGAQQFYRLAQ